jgi:prepilin-type N-terminal cleavage/methylation domain-containing protein
MRRAAGFTLLELVAVMVVISVGLAGLASMFGESGRALIIGEDAQKAAQYGQECAERFMAVRRDLGFVSASTNTTLCDSPAPDLGFTRTVTGPGTTYIGGLATACPNSATCCDITITTTKGTVSSVITLMLVSY